MVRVRLNNIRLSFDCCPPRVVPLVIALLWAALKGASSIFSATSGGAVWILKNVAVGLGARFYAGLLVGLVITDGAVRHDVFGLIKDAISAL